MEPIRIVSQIVDLKLVVDKYKIFLKDSIDGYRRNPKTQVNERDMVDFIYVNPECFRNICATNDRDFDLCRMHGAISVSDLQLICIDAEIVFEREERSEKDGFKTTLLSVVLAEESKKRRLSGVKERIVAACAPAARPVYKEDAEEYRRVLEENGVRRLYHFTRRENLSSIRERGGLFSWYYCELKGWTIPMPGGSADSWSLDVRHGLQNYVRLSFCADHPMRSHVEEKPGDTVLLTVDPDVVLWQDTLYSDMNAVDSSHRHGDDLEMLRSIRFDATQKTHVRQTDPDFKYHQAEVMVKTHIPARYILNLEEEL